MDGDEFFQHNWDSCKQIIFGALQTLQGCRIVKNKIDLSRVSTQRLFVREDIREREREREGERERKVCCVFPLRSPHRGDSNEYIQHTIINIKTKITQNYPKHKNVCSYGSFS